MIGTVSPLRSHDLRSFPKLREKVKLRYLRKISNRRLTTQLLICAMAVTAAEETRFAHGQSAERRSRSDYISEPSAARDQQVRVASVKSASPASTTTSSSPLTTRSGKILIPDASPVKTFASAIPETTSVNETIAQPILPPTPPSLPVSAITTLAGSATESLSELPPTVQQVLPPDDAALSSVGVTQVVSRGPIVAQPAGFRENENSIKRPPITNIPTVSGQSLSARWMQELELAKQKLRHGAHFSARDTGWQVLEQLSQVRSDELQNPGPSAALVRARMNMREAGDFLGRYGNLGPEDLKRIVEAHETTALKHVDLSQVTSHRAADIYFEAARKSLLDALAGQSLSAEALAVVADSHLRSESSTLEDRAIAITCLRAAIGLKPTDSLIANQLGFELLKDGRLDESEKLLKHSLNIASTPEAWQNLAELHRRRGELPLAQQAAMMAQSVRGATSTGPQIEQLTPQQFAQLSPRVQWNNNSMSTVATYPSPATPPANYPAASTPSSPAPPNPLPVSPPHAEPGRVARFFQGMWR